MKIEIITTGTELTTARTIDTNFRDMVRALQYHGITVPFHSTYRDHFEELVDGVSRAMARANVIILTGGLGPTSDDLTRDVASAVFHRPLARNLKTLKFMKRRLRKYGFRRLTGTEKQADFPEGSEIIPNPVGSAPGFYLHDPVPNGTGHAKHFFALPGVPQEMRPMFTRWTLPRVVRLFRNEEKTATTYLKTFGLPELAVERKIRPFLIRQKNLSYGLTVGHGPVNVSVTANGPALAPLRSRLDRIHARLKKIMGPYYLGHGDSSLEQIVGFLLLRQKRTLAIAESCTGGLISHKLTNVPGISAALLESTICYSNDSKIQRLDVRPETLKKHGAVSAETAAEMARGAAKRSGSDIGLSTTGIAGPSGGTPAKPVGLVYFGLFFRNTVRTWSRRFAGDREQIKDRAANMALNLLRLEVTR